MIQEGRLEIMRPVDEECMEEAFRIAKLHVEGKSDGWVPVEFSADGSVRLGKPYSNIVEQSGIEGHSDRRTAGIASSVAVSESTS